MLLFQRDIVASALDELTTGNGSDYIGKIIQVEFDVPKASTKDMQALFFKTLERIIFGGPKKPFFDQDRWRNLFHDHLWQYFRSLRDIKRFSSSFEFYYNRHLNQGVLEVDAVDLVAVEVLRVFDNEAYRKLSRSLFSVRQPVLDLYGDKGQRHEQFNIKMEDIAAHLERENQRERLKLLLLSLFPQAGEYGGSEDAATEWHRRSRICDEKSFHRYFELNLDTSQATQYDLDAILRNAEDRSKTVELLRAAIENETIDSLLIRIFYGREDIPLDYMSAFVTALFDIGDELPERGRDEYSTSCTNLCNKIIYHRLNHEDRNIVHKILLDAHRNTNGFFLPIQHLSLEVKETRNDGNRIPKELLITEENLSTFYEINLNKIGEKAKDGSLLEHRKCDNIIYWWAEWDAGNLASQWVQETAADPTLALRLLVNFLGESRSESGSKVAYKPFLDAKSLDSLIDIKALLEAASKAPESERSEKASSISRTS